jgi:uncharacterized membrane protein
MKRFLFLFSSITVFCFYSKAQSVYTIGPTIQICFDKTSHKISYGIEGAMWDIKRTFLGINMGIEFYNSGFRLYSELESGFIFLGTSLGPVIEQPFHEQGKLGLQISGWVNYYLGFDYKRRFFLYDNEKYTGTGFYFKYIYPPTWKMDVSRRLISGY